MTIDPVRTYNSAIKLMSERRLREAIEQYEALLREYPHFEHGNANYDLAGCYEDLGQYTKAAEQYREALRLEPSNPIFLGGLASFTLLHGDPKESLDLHLRLLREDRTLKEPGKRTGVLQIIRQLATQVGTNVAKLDVFPENDELHGGP